MNIKQEIENSKVYAVKVENTLNVIDEYIDLYNKFNEKYKSIINELKEDYKEFFSSHGFEVKKQYNGYATSMYESEEIIIAKYKYLEFELGVRDDGRIDITFWKRKPENEDIYIRVKMNVEQYRASMDIEDITQISCVKDINRMREEIKNAKFSLDEIDKINGSIVKLKENLLIELSKLKNVFFIGTQLNKGKEENKFKFTKIEELIKEI